MSSSLPNYIRSLRRKVRLSQEDVAYLLGHADGTSVLRHEDYQRMPTLELGLAYAVIFQIDAREVFAGHYEEVEARVRIRAGDLLDQIEQDERTHPAPKLSHLQLLAGSSEPYAVPCED